MKKQPEITALTKKRFVDSFCRLYAEKPQEKITVREVAEMAGYNRVTFYQYFRDIYDVLDHVENELAQKLMCAARENVQRGINAEYFTHRLAAFLRENESTAKLLFCNPHNTHSPARLSRKAMPYIRELFGISAENIKACYAFEFYIPGMLALFGRWLANEDEMSVEQLGQLVHGILKEGILAQLKE